MRFPFKKCASVILLGKDMGSPDPNFAYHAKIDSDNTALLWGKRGGKTIIATSLNARKCLRESKFPVRVLKKGERFSDALRGMLPARKPTGLDFESLSAERYISFKKAFKSKFVDVSEELSEIRAVKSADEISRIRKAAKKSLEILESLTLDAKITELDVLRQLSIACANDGLEFAYAPIVATGINSSMPHHTPGKKKLSGVVLIDFGVKFKNYCSDLTRCYFIGSCKAEKKKYEEAQDVFFGILDSMPGCKTAKDLVDLSVRITKKKGWMDMPHAIGHGIGLEVHESPHLYSKSKQRLRSNMVMAIEPGWYGNKFGVRFENEILFGKKARVLL